MYLTGYNIGAEAVRRHALIPAGLAPAQQIARSLGMCLAFGYPERVGDQVANAAVLIDATGTILLNYRKTHLFGELDRTSSASPARIFRSPPSAAQNSAC